MTQRATFVRAIAGVLLSSQTPVALRISLCFCVTHIIPHLVHARSIVIISA